MRPTESEGVAEGEDEDEEGEVRSERSGPQSWALAATPPATTDDLPNKRNGSSHRNNDNHEHSHS